MKKLFIYYFVGGFTDTYKKISVEDAYSKKMLFYDSTSENFYFSRHNDTTIERIFGHFNSENDPLLAFVIERRNSYFMEEDTNENSI